MGSNNRKVALSENILEIRYKPNSKILDHRGTWAEIISKDLTLTEWLIVGNRFDVHDLGKKNCFCWLS
jgi:hypothetical protein